MKRRKGRVGSLAAGVAMLAVAIAASSAWAAAGPSPFRRDLHRVDGPLRMAIEYGPAELGEALISSETLCRLAEETEARGEVDQAAADWSALTQVVEEIDRPAAGRIDRAFRRADSGLRALRGKYSRSWSDVAKIRQLREGVAGARIGIRMLRSTMEAVAGSFGDWEARECRAAVEAVDAGATRFPAGVEQVNRGMQHLWELAFPDQMSRRARASRAREPLTVSEKRSFERQGRVPGLSFSSTETLSEPELATQARKKETGRID
jgi:hypothetical protein